MKTWSTVGTLQVSARQPLCPSVGTVPIVALSIPRKWRSSHIDWNTASRPAASQTDPTTWDLALPGSSKARPHRQFQTQSWDFMEALDERCFRENSFLHSQLSSSESNLHSFHNGTKWGNVVSLGGWQSQLIPWKLTGLCISFLRNWKNKKCQESKRINILKQFLLAFGMSCSFPLLLQICPLKTVYFGYTQSWSAFLSIYLLCGVIMFPQAAIRAEF